MKFTTSAILALLVAALSATAARDSAAATRGGTVLDAVTARELAAVMTEFGYNLEMKTDSNGDPLLLSKVGETTFTIGFYGCNKNPDAYRRICTDAQYRASYDQPEAASLNLINTWNRDYRFGKAYVDTKGQPTVEMMLNLEGGFTKGYLRGFLKWWTVVLRDFEKHIGWRQL